MHECRVAWFLTRSVQITGNGNQELYRWRRNVRLVLSSVGVFVDWLLSRGKGWWRHQSRGSTWRHAWRHMTTWRCLHLANVCVISRSTSCSSMCTLLVHCVWSASSAMHCQSSSYVATDTSVAAPLPVCCRLWPLLTLLTFSPASSFSQLRWGAPDYYFRFNKITGAVTWTTLL